MIFPAIICIIGLLVDAFVVKVFDEEIRSSRYGKQIINTVTIGLLLLLLYSFIRLILGG
jgi:hypothetical protein